MKRNTANRVGVLVTGVIVLSLVAGCDTGDGKTLQPYDPADYPQPTPGTALVGSSPDASGVDGSSVVDGAFDNGDLGSLPGLSLRPATASPASIEAFTLTAPWQQGESIDPANTCDGVDVAPALSWGGVPDGTVEIVIALVDDSAVSNGEPFVHWVIGGLNPSEIAIAEGDLPAGAVQALNFFGDVGYGGPCPPPGDDPHVYRLTAYALNSASEVADGTRATEFLTAIAPLTLRSTDLSGTYQR